MVGSEVLSASWHTMFPSSSYHIYNYTVEPAPQVQDVHVDNNLPASIKAAEFMAIRPLSRSSLSVFSYIVHFDVASTNLLQQFLEEVSQSNQESGHQVLRCYSTSSCHRGWPSPFLLTLKPRFKVILSWLEWTLFWVVPR